MSIDSYYAGAGHYLSDVNTVQVNMTNDEICGVVEERNALLEGILTKMIQEPEILSMLADLFAEILSGERDIYRYFLLPKNIAVKTLRLFVEEALLNIRLYLKTVEDPERLSDDHSQDLKIIKGNIEKFNIKDVILKRWCTEFGSNTENKSLLNELKEKFTKIDQLRDHVVRANLRLVVFVAKKFKSKQQVSMMDLVQEGNLALMRAVDDFNTDLEVKFSTYAVACIRARIIRFRVNSEKIVRLPVYKSSEIKVLKSIKQAYQDEGVYPDYQLLSQKSGLTREQVGKTLRHSAPIHSLDKRMSLGKILNGNDEASVEIKKLEELITYKQNPSHLEVEAQELEENIYEMLQGLTFRERTVLQLRNGLEKNDLYTLEEIGNLLSVTRERVRQIEVKALNRLRHPSRIRTLERYCA
jgi:RNA polymerase primary sigma factor